MKLTATIQPQTVEISVDPTNMGVSLGSPVVKEYLDVEAYTGAYEVTPSSEVQTLDTAGKRLTQPVTINPIPSNYGLITWNGQFLTVS